MEEVKGSQTMRYANALHGGVLAASVSIAALAASADTMYWWKNAASDSFFDLANWRVENESGSTEVSALATNASDTAVFQKCAASVSIPAGTEVTVGNMTVGTNADNSETSLDLSLGAGAKLTGSGKLLMPHGQKATKSMSFNAPDGGTFSFAGGVEFNRHGSLDFTGTGILVTNTPSFSFKFADNRVTFPAGTVIDTTTVQPGTGEADFKFTVSGPNSVVRGLTYSWGNTSATIAYGDTFVAFTNGVALTDLNFEYFRGLRNILLFDNAEAAFIKNITIKDDLNVFKAKDATMDFLTVSLTGRTNTLAIVDSTVTATKFDVGSNANHVSPLLAFTNATVTVTNLNLSALNGRMEFVDTVCTAQQMNIGASASSTGNVVMVSGPTACLSVHKADNSALLAFASENTTQGPQNTFVVTNGAKMVVDKMRVGGYAGIHDLTFGIYDGAVVTNTGIFRFCNNGASTRGGERCSLVVDNAEFVCGSEIQLGGSNNLVRVANGGIWRSYNGNAATGLIVGGAYDFQVDDGAILLTNTLMLSSDENLPTSLMIGGARGRVSCKDIQCAAGEVTLRIPKTGRSTDEPMLRLTQHTLTSNQELFPDTVNFRLSLDIAAGINSDTAGEYIDLIDISHVKGLIGEHFLSLTNDIDAASLKGCTLEFVQGSGGVENACLRLMLPSRPGLTIIVR